MILFFLLFFFYYIIIIYLSHFLYLAISQILFEKEEYIGVSLNSSTLSKNFLRNTRELICFITSSSRRGLLLFCNYHLYYYYCSFFWLDYFLNIGNGYLSKGVKGINDSYPFNEMKKKAS